MATENNVIAIPLPVAADYSTTGQYLFMGINSSSQAVLIASQGADAIGVLQDNPNTAGHVGRVAIHGMCKAKAGATITAGAKITSGADGRVETAASGDRELGWAVTGGADGEIITILLGVSTSLLP
ncbi:MAG: capsid cement protein [Candidatus Thorarchaeota archaeon]